MENIKDTKQLFKLVIKAFPEPGEHTLDDIAAKLTADGWRSQRGVNISNSLVSKALLDHGGAKYRRSTRKNAPSHVGSDSLELFTLVLSSTMSDAAKSKILKELANAL